jgi:hypothetical protein
MRKTRFSSRWLVLPCLLLAACASSSSTSDTTTTTPEAGVATGNAIVEVQHNRVDNSSALTILIEPEAGGVRANLGVVEPGDTKQFNYNALPGNYRLEAQTSPAIRSPSFRLSNREKASWNMQLNRVTVVNK